MDHAHFIPMHLRPQISYNSEDFPMTSEREAMTAERCAFFLRRFKGEEKMLGPYEQDALDFAIKKLEASAPAERAVAIRAKLLQWEDNGAGELTDDALSFCIHPRYDDPGPDEKQFTASWGEGPTEDFDTIEEAKAWCQQEAQDWVEQIAEAHPAPAVAASVVRMFPMQKGPNIPWSLAEAIYAGYAAMNGTQQTLERIGERGGFGWAEVEYLWDKHHARKAIEAALTPGV